MESIKIDKYLEIGLFYYNLNMAQYNPHAEAYWRHNYFALTREEKQPQPRERERGGGKWKREKNRLVTDLYTLYCCNTMLQ